MHEVRTRVLLRMRMNAHVTKPLSVGVRILQLLQKLSPRLACRQEPEEVSFFFLMVVQLNVQLAHR